MRCTRTTSLAATRRVEQLKKAGARLATLNNEAVWGKFAVDSPLEGTGFELLVPRREARDFVRQGGQARAPYTPYSLENVHDRDGDGIGADHVAGKGNRTRPDLH